MTQRQKIPPESHFCFPIVFKEEKATRTTLNT